MIKREKQEKDRRAISETSKFESTEAGKGKVEKTTTKKTTKKASKSSKSSKGKNSKGKSKGKK